MIPSEKKRALYHRFSRVLVLRLPLRSDIGRILLPWAEPQGVLSKVGWSMFLNRDMHEEGVLIPQCHHPNMNQNRKTANLILF